MSFSQNGSRRYGHVPPAQYGAPSVPQSGLGRRPSFDNGDDAAYFDQGNARRQGMPPPPHPSTTSRPGTAQDELHMGMNAQDQYASARPGYSSNSPVLTNHQQYQQYDPQLQTQSPTVSQPTYNPQQFARTNSQSYAVRQQSNPQLYQASSTSPSYSHAPYNPAAYQPHSPPTPQAIRTGGFGYSAYSSPAIPQSPTYWSQPSYNAPPQVPARAPSHSVYNPSAHGSSYISSSAPPAPPPRPAAYSPVAHSMTPPMNGSAFMAPGESLQASSQTPYPAENQIPVAGNYATYDSSSQSPNRQKSSSLSSIYSSYGSTLPPTTEAVVSTSGLNRHPTLRPLPKAPDEEADDRDAPWNQSNYKTAEEITQDQMYQDIEAAVLGGSSQRPSSNSNRQQNGDLLDNELAELQQYNSTATSTNASTAGRTTVNYDNWDDESDLEAAAGLEAMRIAEEEENIRRHRGNSSASLGVYNPQPTQTSAKQNSNSDSSDDDFGMVDIGAYGGGYDARMSYGNDLLSTTPQPNGEGRPLPSPYKADEMNDYTPTTAQARTSAFVPAAEYQPFTEFPQPARVDTFGTGGLQRPASGHRMSFDDGDDQYNIDYRPTNSRGSERSGSESPFKDDIPEIFYHPGHTSTQRPLPAVPPMSENRTPQLMAAGTYRSHSHHGSTASASTDSIRQYYTQTQDPYGQGMLSPGGSYVPRSSSLSSHPSTPQTVPPVRSKTDADERQARKELQKQQGLRNGTLDGIDSAATQSTMSLDLPVIPVGRRKKFIPDKLSSSDFRQCPEPWALSCIASWLREMAGGETGEGEMDLRAKKIVDGLVALFTHKVPTMNMADAETLATRAVDSLFAAGVLAREEEWVKFGHGTISGVMWQLTGSGCYAPKLHEQEIAGRCYSHHCHRTLKKVNLQTHALPPAKKTEDWASFYKVTSEQITAADKKEVQRQNNMHEIVQSEDVFMDQLDVVRVIYRDELRSWQPPIIAPTRLPKFLTQVFGKVEAIKQVNEDYLLAQLKYRQQEQGPWIVGVSDIFREWIRKAKHAYVEYAAAFPYAAHLIRKESERNILFRQFLDQAQNNKLSNRLDWNTYLKAPITRLQRYSLLLSVVLGNLKQENEEKTNLQIAIEEIRTATFECDAKVDEMQKKVEMIELSGKLNLRPGMERVELNLDHLGRELLYRGDLQRAGANRFQWLETHALLFDHFLVLAKSVYERDATGARKKEKYDVSKLPIPMQLLVLESMNDDPVVKSTLKGLPVTTVTRSAAQPSASDLQLNRLNSNLADRPQTLEHTNTNSSITSNGSGNKTVTSTNLEGDAKAMYPFRIKHLGRTEVYTLYAPSARNRQEWCERILDAKTRHAASLFEQNAEPFRLRVVADSAFAYDAMTASSRGNSTSMLVRGTPLDRAIREMEDQYGTARPGPVCRAQVNCATAFNGYGKSMVAVGTDFGVYVSEANNPRGWARTIQITRVTQITVLEEFSVCLIVADKALIAYHLDAVLPTSNYPAPHNDSLRRAPQKLTSSRDVSFFATARMKDRMLVFYKKKDGMHSRFKVLEPVLQKSTEKRSRLFSKKLISGNGSTEFFREFDEFYIPTDCFGINLFHSYISVSTQRGFELLTLDKKITMSVPDLKEPSIASIAQRVSNQKPLGMFRLSESEFLLCYEESAVYIDKHGDVSRSVIMEFVGKAKNAAMFGAYLVLFDSDFVEIRNAENGRLRQIIAGKDVRCLDFGVSPSGEGPQRLLKFVMGHPEQTSSQIILELVLNEGQRD